MVMVTGVVARALEVYGRQMIRCSAESLRSESVSSPEAPGFDTVFDSAVVALLFVLVAN